MRHPLRRVIVTLVAAGILSLQPAQAWQVGDNAQALLDQAQATLVSDPEKGLALATRAEALEASGLKPQSAILLRAAWLQAEGLFRLRRLDDAAAVLSNTLSISEPDGSEFYGKLLITSARVARARGDNGLALQSFQDAFTVFAGLGNTRYQAIALQGISTLYANARQYERAIEYDRRAAEVHPDDPVIQVASLNNRGNAFRELGRYDDGRRMFEEALAQDIIKSAPLFAVRVYANLSALELAAGELDRARSAVEKAIAIAKDLPSDQVPLLPPAVAAKIALIDGEGDRAVALLNAAFNGIDLEATPEDSAEAHRLSVDVYAAMNMPAKALPHLQAFTRLKDIERNVAASANQAIMNAEFELSNKELTIEKLRASELEKDFDLISAQQEQERLLAIGAVLLAVSIIGFLGWQMRQSRRVRRITEGLNRKLESVNKKLRQSNADLEKASSAKTEFLATTSHEVRTPLNAVINLTGAVLEQTIHGTDAYVKLSTALRSAEHLHEIVSDVLDVARFEGKRVSANLSMISSRTVIEDVINLWRSKAEAKGLAFKTAVDLDGEHFVTDEKLLRQVLSNLLSNAIKFTLHGSVDLHVAGGSAARPLTITVSDTGIGIAPEDQDFIFESFRQVEAGGTRSFQGTGLGLAICKQITDLLGGTIDVASRPGKGSTFCVTLPMAQQPATPQKEISRSLSAQQINDALRDLDVLAAEDNAVNAMVIQTILKGKVRSLTIVENGQEAVNAVEAHNFDMVLMDKQMPVMDGVEATRRIRQLPMPKGRVPIVAVTADAFAAARDELLEAGANDYLAKPMKPDDLKRSIAANAQLAEQRSATSLSVV